MITATLVFVFRGDPYDQILLGDKKRGFAQGKVDGFGGKVRDGEIIPVAAARELEEETGLTVSADDLLPIGRVLFDFPSKPEWDHEVHIYVARSWTGEPVESEEMRPSWYRIDQIPYERMWDDSRYWMPHIIAGKKIQAGFTYAQDNQTVDHYELDLE